MTSRAHFRVVDLIGEGGMWRVYRAEDTNLQREVALKLLPAGVTADKARRRRFLREARTAAGLTHPNIATVFEAGEAEGRVFLAMEPVRGVLVREMLRQGPLPVPRAIAVAREHPLALAPRGSFGLCAAVRGQREADHRVETELDSR